MPACVVCGSPAPSNLCDACAKELDSPLPFVAEQILSSWIRPLDAALVDTWGRAHRLEAKTTIGRTPLSRGISILDGSVSRRHAEISRGPNGWQVTDLGSSNGTRVNDVAVEAGGTVPLAPKDRVTFGSVGFYFVDNAEQLVEPDVNDVASRTLRPGDASALKLTRPQRASAAAGAGQGEVQAQVHDERSEDTFAGLPSLELLFIEAPSGGGGYLQLAGRQLQLTDTQFALLIELTRRMDHEIEIAPVVRGFVPSGQLIADLPWDSSNPNEAHLKQLVRRVRAILDTVSLGTLIESRRGFGYRLRAIPRRPFEPGKPASAAH